MSKPLVTYFGATGTTEKTVRRIAAGMAQALDVPRRPILPPTWIGRTPAPVAAWR